MEIGCKKKYDKMNTPEQVASYFIESAPRKELCIDFDLQKMLDIYQKMRIETNFTEAALIIISAAQIYSRKIDYLEEMILNIHRESNISEKPEQIRKKKPFRPQTISDIYSEQFSESALKILPAASITTKLQKIKKMNKSKFERLLNSCAELRLAENKTKKIEILKYLEYESNFHTTLTNLNLSRKNQIIDYESEELCGTRYDFRIHQNNVDERNGKLTVDYDFIELSNEKSNALLDCHRNNENNRSDINIILPPFQNSLIENLDKQYFDPIQDLMESEFNKDSLPEETSDKIEQQNSMRPESDKQTKNFSLSLNNQIESDINNEVSDICRDSRISIDEGISVDSIKSRSPSVCIYDCLNGFKKFHGMEKICFDATMFTSNKTNAEQMLSCIQFLEINLLKIPENKLRKQSNFQLPENYKPNKPKKSQIMEEKKRSVTPNSLIGENDFLGFEDHQYSNNLSRAIHMRSSSPSETDFLGFEDDVDLSFSNIKSSTILIDSNTNSDSSPNRKTSQDSGISDNCEQQDNRNLGDVSKSDSHDKYLQSVIDAKLLIEKVQNWHKQLKPILMESEMRCDFDIHEIGTHIIDAFNNDTYVECPIITFENIMVSKEIDYTSRYFLSMLQLANSNNIEIHVKNKSASKCSYKSDIELKLISRVRQNLSEEIIKKSHIQHSNRKRKQNTDIRFELHKEDSMTSAKKYQFFNLDVASKSSFSVINSAESGYHSLSEAL